ncbi:MAG: SRPBCC family protein [Chitinophagaceae bacterium]|nr:MAG: SRPBCC family protein [Chitinophagaceae bacterium]
MELIKFTESIQIKAKSELVFDFTQDYNKRLQWDTFLKKADLIEGAPVAAKGIKAYCVAKNGLGMITEYVSFNRPKVAAVKMTKGPYMFSSFQASWNFKDVTECNTEVIFIYSFSLRFPFMLFKKYITLNLRNNVKQRLTDLKFNIESQI